MSKNLNQLYPAPLWNIFANICAIPHPSKHEDKILVWLKEWAKENKIDYAQDETGNIISQTCYSRNGKSCSCSIASAHRYGTPSE